MESPGPARIGVWNHKLSPLNDHEFLSDLSAPKNPLRPLSGVLLGARNFSDNLESELGLTTGVSHFSLPVEGDLSGIPSRTWLDSFTQLYGMNCRWFEVIQSNRQFCIIHYLMAWNKKLYSTKRLLVKHVKVQRPRAELVSECRKQSNVNFTCFSIMHRNNVTTF